MVEKASVTREPFILPWRSSWWTCWRIQLCQRAWQTWRTWYCQMSISPYERSRGVFFLGSRVCRQQCKEADRHLRQQGLPAFCFQSWYWWTPSCFCLASSYLKIFMEAYLMASNLKNFFYFVLGCNQLMGGSAVQNLPAVQETERHGFDPRVRKIPWRRKWQPTPVFM